MLAIEMIQERVDPAGDAEPDPGEWAGASCRDGSGSLTALFFSDEIPDIIEAKQICGLCSLRAPCLDGALERREPWGVWGGELLLNGRILSHKRKRGRPPKNARAGISLIA